MKRAIPLLKKKVPVFLVWVWLLLPVSSFAVNLAAVPAQWIPPGSTVPITMWGFIPDPGSCPSSPVSWNTGPVLTAAPGATLSIQLRNCLADMPPAEAIEFLMQRMSRVKTNQEFMDSMAAGG